MRHSATALFRAHRASSVAAERGFLASRRKSAHMESTLLINLVAFGAIAATLLAGLVSAA